VKERFDVPAAVENVKYYGAFIVNAIDDDVAPDREGAQTES